VAGKGFTTTVAFPLKLCEQLASATETSIKVWLAVADETVIVAAPPAVSTIVWSVPEFNL
jgi:hypothetical protein